MSVQSGVLPYEYIDIPFTFIGRGSGDGFVGVPWSDISTPIPEISGFLYEQAMYVHLAELRKYDQQNNSRLFYSYLTNHSSGIIPIGDPDPTGFILVASGNPYSLDFIEDMRVSLQDIFGKIALDSPYTSGEIREDYFKTQFFDTPNGRSGNYQYNITNKTLFYGSLPPLLTGSGLMDTRTIEELSYQPYARFSKRGTKTVNGVAIETAPFMPACIRANGNLPASSDDEEDLSNVGSKVIGYPQASGFNPLVNESGVLRVCGDGLSSDTRLRIFSEEGVPTGITEGGERWIGIFEWINGEVPESDRPRTNGMALFDSRSNSLRHGVHRAIIESSGTGYGIGSGTISVYPSGAQYSVTGFVNDYIGTSPDNGYGVVRNSSDGEPDNGVSLITTNIPDSVEYSEGIHVCNKVFGLAGASGLFSISPFNGRVLNLNGITNDNLTGEDGSLASAAITKYPPGAWVWRQSYNNRSIFFRDIGTLIAEPGSDTAFAYVASQWVFRSYSSFQVDPPDPTQAGNQTAGLGQTEKYHFAKVNLSSRSAEAAGVSYAHINHFNDYGITGFGYSRNYGWFGTGGASSSNHNFESFRISDPDSGSFTPSNAGPLSISNPIGIGTKAFVRYGPDIAANIYRFWEVSLGNSTGYNTILVDYYNITDGSGGTLPFDINDFESFVGHTIFVTANAEGITVGDWIVVNTTGGTRYLCRLELSTNEIQIVECLYPLEQGSAAVPEVFMTN